MKRIIPVILLGGISLAHSAIAAEIGIHYVVDSSIIDQTFTEADLREELDFWNGEMNSVYRNSGVDISIKTVRVSIRNISVDGNQNPITNSTVLRSNMILQENGFEDIRANASEFGADYTLAILPPDGLTNNDGGGLCGRAAQVSDTLNEINGTNFFSTLAMFDYDCGHETVIHEMGHLMGLGHGTQVSEAYGNTGHNNGIADYALGWGRIIDLVSDDGSIFDENYEEGEIGDIMVGNHVATWARVNAIRQWDEILEQSVIVPLDKPIFSNPNITDALFCGVERNIVIDEAGEVISWDPILDQFGNTIPNSCGDSDVGDAARALNENRENYARHETLDVHAINYRNNNLANCVRQQYPFNQSNDESDIDRIVDITCPNRNIDNIDGLEQVTGLKTGFNGLIPSIDLSDNQFIDLSPLLTTQILSVIDISGNNLANCHQLDELARNHPNLIRPERCLPLAAVLTAITQIL